jgi:protein-tyrosine-phosphatase
MAERLYKQFLNRSGISKDWRVESAGIWAWDGALASSGAVKAMDHWGINLTDHRSRSIDSIRIHDFDLILTMERDHKEALQVEYPALKDHIYMISEMIGEEYDIHDPIGAAPIEYERTAREIADLIELGFERITLLISDFKGTKG